MNRFSYIMDDYMVNKTLELNMLVKARRYLHRQRGVMSQHSKSTEAGVGMANQMIAPPNIYLTEMVSNYNHL
jgi:hypothetical protein